MESVADFTARRHASAVCAIFLYLYLSVSVCLLRHVRRQWALLSFHSVRLSGCLSVIPRHTAYHDCSITTRFCRQVYTCPRTRVSLFGSPISHTLGARGKNMQNFAYFQCVFLPLRTWRIVPYDLSVCLSVTHRHCVDNQGHRQCHHSLQRIRLPIRI